MREVAANRGRPSAFGPLAGIRVVEFSQMVMGPTCGLILADLGADVVKVEPLEGDRTRFFKGPASGFFANYCRNKRSVAVDTTAAAGQEVARRLIGTADVLIENFRPGLLRRFGPRLRERRGVRPARHLLLAEGLPARAPTSIASRSTRWCR